MNLIEAINKLEENGFSARIQSVGGKKSITGGDRIIPDKSDPMSIQIEGPFFISQEGEKWIVEFERMVPTILVIKVTLSLEEAVNATIFYGQFKKDVDSRWLTRLLLSLNYMGIIVEAKSSNSLYFYVTNVPEMSQVEQYLRFIFNQEDYIPYSKRVEFIREKDEWRLVAGDGTSITFPLDTSEKTLMNILEWVKDFKDRINNLS